MKEKHAGKVKVTVERTGRHADRQALHTTTVQQVLSTESQRTGSQTQSPHRRA